MRNKLNKFSLLLFVMLLGSVLLAACGGGDDPDGQTDGGDAEGNNEASNDEVTVIKIADSFPTTHLIPETTILPWIERIEELGEGKIEVEYYPAEQLGKADSLLDTLKNKVTDIAYIGSMYMTDSMPLSSIAGNPGLVQDAISGSQAYEKLLKEDLYELEFEPNGIKPLWAMTTNPYQIVNSKHAVESIEDFKGLKVRTSGGIQEAVVQNFGATPVSVSGPEIYTSWDRGTIDGTLLSLLSWQGYQVDKIATHATVNAALSGFGVIYAVNEESWDSWPEEVQQIVQQASEEVPSEGVKRLVEYENELMEKYAEEDGIEFYELPEDELAKWNEELAPFNNQWAEDLEARGLPAKDILDIFLEYNKEFIE